MSRKEFIVKCASELFLKKGYDRTSIRDVAAASGISMATLYHYISTKENLLKLVVEYHNSSNNKIIDQIERAIKSSDPESALLDAIRILLTGIDGHKERFVFVFAEAKLMPKHIRSVILETEAKIISVFKRIIVDGKKRKIFNFNNPELIAHHIVSMIEMWGVKWWYLKQHATLDEFNQSLNNFILSSLHGADCQFTDYSVQQKKRKI